ncbi:MAG: hypothetical protein IKX43_00850 [Paludibacteraceae bacterium]|nr:hypothetical protein [Paludibacteraceae bacterium]
MKITKIIISAVLPFSLALNSCDKGIEDSYELGRKVDWPEMSAEERGLSNGETLAKALYSICDSVASAKGKNLSASGNLSDEPIFRGMLTSPLSKTQRPFELSTQNETDSLWMRGFKAGLNETLKLDEKNYTELMKLLAQINYADIDCNANAQRCTEINDLLK